MMSTRNILRRLPTLVLLIACGCNAFQPALKQRTSPQWKSALTSDYASTYADTVSIEDIIPISFSPIELPKVQSSPLVELFGEAFGTFWIVGIGSMASMTATFINPMMTLPQVAMIWSAAVTSAILITSPLSGAHLNPAMTLVLALFRKFEWKKVLPYCGAQVLGSAAGSAMSFGLFQNAIRGFEQSQGIVRACSIESASVFGEYFSSSLSTAQAFGIEAAGTAVLAAIVFAITHERNSHRDIPVPFVVGGTVFVLSNLLAPFTQCGLNPARDFGPRLIAFLGGWTDVAFQDCWLYILAPMLGALTGATLIEKIFYNKKEPEVKVDHTLWL